MYCIQVHTHVYIYVLYTGTYICIYIMYIYIMYIYIMYIYLMYIYICISLYIIYIYAQVSPGKGSALQLPGFAKDAPDGFRGDRISDAGAL